MFPHYFVHILWLCIGASHVSWLLCTFLWLCIGASHVSSLLCLCFVVMYRPWCFVWCYQKFCLGRANHPYCRRPAMFEFLHTYVPIPIGLDLFCVMLLLLLLGSIKANESNNPSCSVSRGQPYLLLHSLNQSKINVASIFPSLFLMNADHQCENDDLQVCTRTSCLLCSPVFLF